MRRNFDVAIIGSGAGGGMAAYMLTKAGADVVMLEAGPMWNAAAKVATVIELNDASLLLRIVVRVITESLAPFISGFVTKASGAKTTSLDSK